MRHGLRLVAGALLLAGAAWLFVLAFEAEAGPAAAVAPCLGRGGN